MFIFGREKELVNHIIENKDKIEELKDDIIIRGEIFYGQYYDYKYRKKHCKYSDIVTTNLKTLRLIEVRCGYITPELVRKSLDAIRNKQFYKNIELVFIGTKISKALEEELKSMKNVKYIILKDVKYIKGYKDHNFKKIKFKPDVEIYAYNYINSFDYGKKNEYDEYKFNFNRFHVDDKRKQVSFEFKFDNEYGLNIIISLIELESRNEKKYVFDEKYEITNIESCNILAEKSKGFPSELYIYNFLDNIPRGYLDYKDINEIMKIISYGTSKRRWYDKKSRD